LIRDPEPSQHNENAPHQRDGRDPGRVPGPAIVEPPWRPRAHVPAAAAKHVIGADPYHVEALRILIGNPRVFSTIEVALLDLIGRPPIDPSPTFSAGLPAAECRFLPTSSTRRPARTTGVEP
jgi:hypothetical protein